MGLFSKKDKSDGKENRKPLDYDPLNILITDLRPGFFVDYNFKTYEILDGIEFKMKDFTFRKLRMDTAGEQVVILIMSDGRAFIAQEVKMSVLGADLLAELNKSGNVPDKLTYESEEFSLDRQSDGVHRDLNKNLMDWSKAVVWKYGNADGSCNVYICQTGASSFEAIFAKSTNPAEFANFIARTK